MSVGEARAFLDRHGLAPSRKLGQNFLHDEQLADKLVRLAGVGPDEGVLEVGTGLGILTRALAARARRVISVEVDAGLVAALRAEQALPEPVTLLHADALRLDLAAQLAELAGDGPVSVVANLPYSVATPLLRSFLDLWSQLRSWSVMIQKEMAARIVAPAGGGDYGSFSVLHQWLAEPRVALDLHPQCFYPVPKVTSTFLCLAPRRDVQIRSDELAAIERILRAGFAHRRKTLVNSLRTAAGVPSERALEALADHGLDPRIRAQALDPATWLSLARQLVGTAT